MRVFVGIVLTPRKLLFSADAMTWHGRANSMNRPRAGVRSFVLSPGELLRATLGVGNEMPPNSSSRLGGLRKRASLPTLEAPPIGVHRTCLEMWRKSRFSAFRFRPLEAPGILAPCAPVNTPRPSRAPRARCRRSGGDRSSRSARPRCRPSSRWSWASRPR